jgi:T-complex protein 1 subunit theta
VNDDYTSVATVILLASSFNRKLTDVERALDDGIHSGKALFQDFRLLTGAGAVELELSKRLKAFAEEDKGTDQYAIRKFAEAFEVVPRTLAENSVCDPTNIMHSLHSSHKNNGDASTNYGFNIETHEPFDAFEANIFDLYATKSNALRLAVDAALTVLRVDQIVMIKPAGGPKPKSGPIDPKRS